MLTIKFKTIFFSKNDVFEFFDVDGYQDLPKDNDVTEGDDISLHQFPQYPAHMSRFDSKESLHSITRQSDNTFVIILMLP